MSNAATKDVIGFIGIGLMGTPMTLRLLDQGRKVVVWNREPSRADPVVAAGAVWAPSPRAVAEASDIVLLCVLNTEAVSDCIWGSDGVAEAARGARLLIDHSTIDPAATRDFATRLKARTSAGWVDAPVSGGPAAARTGTLTIMAGAGDTDWVAARPVLADLGANITRVGGVGAGQVAKIINQAIVGSGFVLMAEALRLAEQAGIDAAAIPACLAGGFADSTLLQRVYPQMQRRAFDPPLSFSRQLLKDMKAVTAFADGLQLSLPMVQTACARYAAHVGRGHGMEDSASILRLYEEQP
ncbi:NAD(P)-dependent oxidoreductase [Limobrevibacterium gyesilva]|uniref:NAD(P)-dependent oxidoreductase n=1 Tax=Limobrevibacterium gyesilva TaxID=2991712 RepID=A0AA41YS72_9PROT|nr:NAD(P)-dependent oxidoreductase [Limobrevibacterium gyesilva]MCW3475555.1 NAD(P)-dependent oxidoreductase [Limobrevibacterium gyesilva]